MHNIIIFGEVLFDHFPDGNAVLGGAPFNVAWHLQAFGLNPLFISRIGMDSEGERVRDAMSSWGMTTAYLQTDGQYPTGQVRISIENGDPQYDICADQAYDHIQIPDISTINPDAILYHGALAARSPASRQTLTALTTHIQDRIFIDVNLRSPWWKKAEVMASIRHARWLKLNADEFEVLSQTQGDLDTRMADFLQTYQLETLIVTLGDQGALAVDRPGNFHRIAPEPITAFVDTVGAGDAFASILLLGLHKGWSLAQTLTRAQQFASAIVGKQGATVADAEFYQAFIKAWQC